MWAGPRLVSIRRRGSCAEGAWLKRGGVVSARERGFREGRGLRKMSMRGAWLKRGGGVYARGRGFREGAWLA